MYAPAQPEAGPVAITAGRPKASAVTRINLRIEFSSLRKSKIKGLRDYFATMIAGGCHEPSPGGSTDGASVFGQ